MMKMKKDKLLLFLIVISFQLTGQDLKIKLWPNGAPNKNTPPGKEEYFKQDGVYQFRNISEAELYVYQPKKENNTGVAVIICAGGGYGSIAIDHEGFQIAEYLKFSH